jgi:hypothetical protein
MVRPRVAARCEHVNDLHKRFLCIGFGPLFRILNTQAAEQACGNAPGRACAARPGALRRHPRRTDAALGRLTTPPVAEGTSLGEAGPADLATAADKLVAAGTPATISPSLGARSQDEDSGSRTPGAVPAAVQSPRASTGAADGVTSRVRLPYAVMAGPAPTWTMCSERRGQIRRWSLS